MDYPFQIACVHPPPPLRKNRRSGVCGGGDHCAQTDNPFLDLVLKRPMFLMIAKDCTERLSAVALSIGLIIPRG